MTLQDLHNEIAALPKTLRVTAPAGAAPEKAASPLEIVARQGRLILKLSAATDSLATSSAAIEARYQELAQSLRESERRYDELAERACAAEARTKKIAQEAVRMFDALEWACDAAMSRGSEDLARDLASARRDFQRRLAAVGITEIPVEGAADGRLHESVDTKTTSDVPRYHIVQVVRRGYQYGPDILRRAEVITAA